MRRLAITIGVVIALNSAYGEEVRITDFTNGSLEIQPCETGALYRVEWTPAITSSWSFTSPFIAFQATSSVTYVSFPNFYRATELNYTGAWYGVFYYDTTPQTDLSLELYRLPDHTLVATTNTGPFGEYAFTNLLSGSYRLEALGGSRYVDVEITDRDIRRDFVDYRLYWTDGIFGNGYPGQWPLSTETISTNCPTFRWDPIDVPGVRYIIILKTASFETIASAVTHIPQYQFTNVLETGTSYRWDLWTFTPLSVEQPTDDMRGDLLYGFQTESLFTVNLE